MISLWISFIQLTHYKIRFPTIYFSSRTLYRTKSKNNAKLAIYKNIKAKQNKISKAQRIRISVIFENCYNLFQQSFSFKKKPKYFLINLAKECLNYPGKWVKKVNSEFIHVYLSHFDPFPASIVEMSNPGFWTRTDNSFQLFIVSLLLLCLKTRKTLKIWKFIEEGWNENIKTRQIYS